MLSAAGCGAHARSQLPAATDGVSVLRSEPAELEQSPGQQVSEQHASAQARGGDRVHGEVQLAARPRGPERVAAPTGLPVSVSWCPVVHHSGQPPRGAGRSPHWGRGPVCLRHTEARGRSSLKKWFLCLKAWKSCFVFPSAFIIYETKKFVDANDRQHKS